MAGPYVTDVVVTTIAQNQSLSPQANIGDKTLIGIFLPSTWTAASLSFQASPDGGTTFAELVDSNAAAIAVSSITAGTNGTFIALDPSKWRGINCIKVRSGTSGAPVNQTNAAGAAIQLLTRYIA